VVFSDILHLTTAVDRLGPLRVAPAPSGRGSTCLHPRRLDQSHCLPAVERRVLWCSADGR